MGTCVVLTASTTSASSLDVILGHALGFEEALVAL